MFLICSALLCTYKRYLHSTTLVSTACKKARSYVWRTPKIHKLGATYNSTSTKYLQQDCVDDNCWSIIILRISQNVYCFQIIICSAYFPWASLPYSVLLWGDGYFKLCNDALSQTSWADTDKVGVSGQYHASQMVCLKVCLSVHIEDCEG